MNEHRIQQTSIALTVERQTPRDEFGSRLAQAIGSAAGAIAPMVPVVSAAVSGLAPVTGLAKAFGGSGGSSAMRVQGSGPASGQAVASAGVGPTPPASSGGETGALGGSSWDLVNAQKQMNAESQSFNMQYLALQDSMQKESREFNAITNIMKVRHDSAKAAINNIH